MTKAEQTVGAVSPLEGDSTEQAVDRLMVEHLATPVTPGFAEQFRKLPESHCVEHLATPANVEQTSVGTAVCAEHSTNAPTGSVELGRAPPRLLGVLEFGTKGVGGELGCRNRAVLVVMAA